MKVLPLALVLAGGASALSGCAREIITRDVPVEVRVPVIQPCALAPPDRPQALKDAFPDPVWAEMDTRQRAAAVGAAGLRWQEYAEQLDAGTAGCARLP